MSTPGPRTLAYEVTDAFRIVIASAIAMVVVLTASLTWFISVGDPEIDRAAQTVSISQDAQSALIGQQSLLRSYVITGDSTVLSTYAALTSRISRDRQQLLKIARGGEAANLARAFSVADIRWQRGWVAAAIDPSTRVTLISPAGGLDAASVSSFIRGGRDSAADVQGAAQAVFRAGIADQTHARRTTLGVVVGTALVLLLVGISSAMATLRRRRALDARVVGPIGVLLAKVQAVGRGEFSASPVIDAPLELLELRDELADMSASLKLQQQALATRADDAAASARRLALVVDFAREISDSLTLTNVLSAVTSAGRRLLESPRARVWLLDADAQVLQLRHDSITGAAVTPTTHPVGDGGLGRAAQDHLLFYSAGMSGDQSDGASNSLVVAVPLLKGNRLIGVLEIVLGPDAQRLDDDTVGVLAATAGHAATAIDAALLYALSESLSRSDPLTGLANRRQLDQDVELEVERAGRYHRPMTFLMIDIDHFKSVNDRFGHSLGDSVLAEVGALLREQMRSGDTAYRYGGEEFAVLARDTDLAGGCAVAERLRQAVEDRDSGNQPGDVSVTISVGVATIATDTETGPEVMAAADMALYDAKRSGRNRVRVAPADLPQQRAGDTVYTLP